MYFTGKRERVRESAREAKSRRVGECEMWKFVIFVFILRLAFQTILYFSSLRTQSSNQMRSDPLQIHKYVLQWCVFFWPSCGMLSFLLAMRLANIKMQWQQNDTSRMQIIQPKVMHTHHSECIYLAFLWLKKFYISLTVGVAFAAYIHRWTDGMFDYERKVLFSSSVYETVNIFNKHSVRHARGFCT